MAADTGSKSSTDKNLQAHLNGYNGFIRLLKYTMVIVAIVTAAVIYIIAN